MECVNRCKSAGSRLQAAISEKFSRGGDKEDQKEQPSCFERFFSWKKLALLLLVLCIGVITTLVVLMVIHYRFSSCMLWLSDISILQLPSQPALDDADLQIKVALLLEIYNPTLSVGSLMHTSFRLSFVDYLNNVTYEANEQVRFPASNTYCPQGNSSVQLPSTATQDASLHSNLTIANAAGKVAHLLSHGCFGIHATGQVSYDVGILSHTTVLTRSFQLFADGACPCPT